MDLTTPNVRQIMAHYFALETIELKAMLTHKQKESRQTWDKVNAITGEHTDSKARLVRTLTKEMKACLLEADIIAFALHVKETDEKWGVKVND